MSTSDDHALRPSQQGGLGRRVKRAGYAILGGISAIVLVVGCATLVVGFRLHHPEPLEGMFVYPFGRTCYGLCPHEVREMIFIGSTFALIGLCGIIVAYRLLAVGRGNDGAGEKEERDG